MRIFYARHSAPSENHLILSQRAGFVREDILDLPQVLRDVQSPALQLGVGLLVVQLQVLVDEVHLAHLDDLDGDVERNGDQDLEDSRQHGVSGRGDQDANGISLIYGNDYNHE